MGWRHICDDGFVCSLKSEYGKRSKYRSVTKKFILEISDFGGAIFFASLSKALSEAKALERFYLVS